MTYYVPTEEDLNNLDGTVEAAVTKYLALDSGELTPWLSGLAEKLRERTGTVFCKQSEDFVVQCWSDASSPSAGVRYDIADPVKQQEFKDRFNQLQVTVWNFTDNTLHKALHDFITQNNFPLLVQLRSCNSRIRNALKDKSVPNSIGMGAFGTLTQRVDVLNYVNGEVVELVVHSMLMETAEMLRHYPSIFAINPDSEVVVEVLPGEVTTKVAEADGIEDVTLHPPQGEDYTKIVEEDDDTLCHLRWHYKEQNHNTVDRTVAAISRDAWMNLDVLGDTQYNPYEVQELDGFQQWVPTCGPDRAPGLVAFNIELLRAKNRLCDQVDKKIIVGPQLGTWHMDADRVRHRRATPPDIYSVGAWLSPAFGSQGITGWGMSCVFKTTQDTKTKSSEGGGFYPNGEALWQTLAKLQEQVYRPLSKLFMRWEPAPRKTAILFSTVDTMFRSGTSATRARGPLSTDRLWKSRKSLRNCYLATLYFGEPADIVFDVEVENGILANYDTLLVPCLYVANRRLINTINDFMGRVLTHADSAVVLENPDTCTFDLGLHDQADPNSLAPDYTIYNNHMTAIEFDKFLHFLASEIHFFHEGYGRWGPYNSVISNKMIDGADTYHVLVNDTRIPGPEAEWYQDFTGRPGKFADVGVDVTINNTTGKVLQDVLSGELFMPGQDMVLRKSWGRVLREVIIKGQGRKG